MTISDMEKLKAKLEHYCAYQERCHADVEGKLYGLGVSSNYHSEVIVYLIEQNFLNEERFAKSFARGKHNISYWGRNRIALELKQRKISSYLINIALKQIDEKEYVCNFEKVSLQKWISLKERELAKRKKATMDYLYRKGYEYEMIVNRIEDLLVME